MPIPVPFPGAVQAAHPDEAAHADVRAVAWLALATSVGLNAAAAILQASFAFPAILRRPAAEALDRFAAHAPTIIGAYYLFALVSLVQGALVIAARRVLGRPGSLALDLATAAGVGMALVQAMGFLRWVFMAPALVALRAAPGADAASRAAVLVAQETMNRFAGVAVGEHLGWLLTATWLVGTGVHAWRHPSAWFGRRGAAVAVACGALIAVSAAEQFGARSPLVAAAFYGGYVTYTLLLVPLALRLLVLVRRRAPSPVMLTGGARA